MNHTPGPWHWDSDAIKGDPLDRRRYRVTALGRTITQIYYTSEWSGQAEADAKLIACAPDMLDVLRAVAAHFEDTDAPLGSAARALIQRVSSSPETSADSGAAK